MFVELADLYVRCPWLRLYLGKKHVARRAERIRTQMYTEATLRGRSTTSHSKFGEEFLETIQFHFLTSLIDYGL